MTGVWGWQADVLCHHWQRRASIERLVTLGCAWWAQVFDQDQDGAVAETTFTGDIDQSSAVSYETDRPAS